MTYGAQIFSVSFYGRFLTSPFISFNNAYVFYTSKHGFTSADKFTEVKGFVVGLLKVSVSRVGKGTLMPLILAEILYNWLVKSLRLKFSRYSMTPSTKQLHVAL